MLSIIICSRSPKLVDELKQNVESTIGVPFQWIVIDNSTNSYSIFSAYNEGIRKSSFPYLCFVHEDVAFQTKDWGKTMCAHLSDPSVGMVGVCGSMYQSKVPASWGQFENTAYIVQSDKNRKLNKPIASEGYDERHEKQVVALDGVFLAAPRTLFDHIAFDQETYGGFHAYDLDICLQSHNLGRRNLAINDLLLIHYSKGSHNRNWVENLLLFAEKWRECLPISVGNHPIDSFEQREERYMNKTFLKNLIRSGYSDQDCKRILKRCLSDNSSFVEWVNSPRFNRWLFVMRLKKKPSSLVKRLS